MIQLKNLKKSFKQIEAVKGISFEVMQGEIFGLLGENGAGKTTTLRMLATMLQPTGGTAEVAGYDIVTDPEKVRGEIGILFGGEMGLYDRLTAKENIKYFAELNDMKNEDIENRVSYLVDILDMKEYVNRRVGKFSKGMKQKVAIARSIIHNPQVMLFDEPTSGLDVTSARIVHDFIRSCKEEGKTIIFSSHSMKEVEKLCDRIGIIHKGEMVDIGTIEELKRKHDDEDLEEVFMKLVGEKNEA
ncbi:MAG: ATP-binding cassette domain-containing protein [Bacillota bacterium]